MVKSYSLNRSELYFGDYRKTLSSVQNVRLILTSPPYNIGSKGTRRDGLRKLGKYDAKSFGGISSYKDNLPEDIYQDGQRQFILWALDRLKPNGVIAYVHKNRHKGRRLITPYEWILPLVKENQLCIYEEIVWDRGSTHNHDRGYLYPETERVFILCKSGSIPYFKNYDPEGRVKGMSDVWRISRARKSTHDAAFPLELAQRLINCYSKPRELVMDPFSGSGTTFIAAQILKRRFVGSELSNKHYMNACNRISASVNETASAVSY